MRDDLSLIETYIKDHKKVKVKTTGIPRFLIKWQGKRDAKKKIFQEKDMEAGSYFEKEKAGIFGQIVNKERLYLEKCLFDIRKECALLIAEYGKNLQELAITQKELETLASGQSGIELRRQGKLHAKAAALEERNLEILGRVYEIDEIVTSTKNCSEDWLWQHAERINEKRMLYYMGVRKVLPQIEMPQDMLYTVEQTVHESDERRKQFLKSVETIEG